jgi:hypothetical protein
MENGRPPGGGFDIRGRGGNFDPRAAEKYKSKDEQQNEAKEYQHIFFLFD